MKKRIIYYIILAAVLGCFLVFNYSSVQKCDDIRVLGVIGGENIIVEGELSGNYRSVRSVKSEKIGNNFYIKIEAVNDFFNPRKDFKVTIPNKKNEVEKVFLADKKSSIEIFINSDFGKEPEPFNVSIITD